jgi:predicted enzyme related to lactoylglutathione lyase
MGDDAAMAIRFAHTNLVAHDWQRLARFYALVFECEPLEPERDLRGDWLDRGTRVRGAHLRGRHLRLPGHGAHGPTLEIFQYDEMLPQDLPTANRAGFGHIAFQVDDVEAKLREVVAAGGSTHGEIVESDIAGAGRLTFTYARDPEGNLIELQAWS